MSLFINRIFTNNRDVVRVNQSSLIHGSWFMVHSKSPETNVTVGNWRHEIETAAVWPTHTIPNTY